jgi:transcriptional regulator with XRE-family HTH domain
MAVESTGEILRAMRKKANLNVEELALKIGIHRSYVYRLENGEAEPSLTIVKEWVKATRPSWGLMWRLLVPREFEKHYRENRGRKRDGD